MDATTPPTTEINQHVALDINTEWLESVKWKACISMRREPPANPTIFRVPPRLRRCNNQHDYEPKLISIGPYHRGKSGDLKAMEELKWRMLYHYLSIVPNGSNNEGLRKIKDLEKRARDCYSEVIDLDSNEFVEMLLLDGCFLVQIFITRQALKANDDQQTLPAKELKSLLSNNMWFGKLITRDLLLLENQLPYFIIKHLLKTLGMHEWDSRRLQSIAISCFNGLMPQCSNIPEPINLPERGFQVDHLLHLFHKWISSISKEQNPRKERSCWQLTPKLFCYALSLMINKTEHCLSKMSCCNNPLPSKKHPRAVPTMTELHEAGVKVKVREANIFLDISFCKDKGELEIPAIDVDDYINFFFANLIAFEQCCRKHGLDVTHYTLFLDDIIDTQKDVKLLNQKEIVHRSLGDDEDIASLFNKLGKGVTYDPKGNYLKNTIKGLNTYCESRYHRWRAKAMHDYFNNPWTFISLIAAGLLLVLTILQTIYVFLSYYKK